MEEEHVSSVEDEGASGAATSATGGIPSSSLCGIVFDETSHSALRSSGRHRLLASRPSGAGHSVEDGSASGARAGLNTSVAGGHSEQGAADGNVADASSSDEEAADDVADLRVVNSPASSGRASPTSEFASSEPEVVDTGELCVSHTGVRSSGKRYLDEGFLHRWSHRPSVSSARLRRVALQGAARVGGTEPAKATAPHDHDGHDSDGDGDGEGDAEGDKAARKPPERLRCLRAATSLVVPFSWNHHRPDPHTPSERARSLLRRTIPGLDGAPIPLWERGPLPHEVGTLSTHFRALVGHSYHDIASDAFATSSCQRLRLNRAVRQWIFPNARLWTFISSHQYAGKLVGIGDVDLTIFPHGGILSIHLDWIPSDAIASMDDFYLSDLRTWLYVAKWRSVRVGVAGGWTFGEEEGEEVLDDALRAPLHAALGGELYSARFGTERMDLATWADWLIMSSAEAPLWNALVCDPISQEWTLNPDCVVDVLGSELDEHAVVHNDGGGGPEGPPSVKRMEDVEVSFIRGRVSAGDTSIHHTHAVVAGKPTDTELEEYLFHLRRAYGSKKRPPPPDRDYRERHSLDQVLLPRSNQAMGLCREGNVLLQWDTSSYQWKRWQGVYRILGIHVFSERTVLEKLGFLAATRAASLPLPYQSRTVSVSGQERHRMRVDLMSLATMLVSYRLSMASDDCGGRSEYSVFFTTLRHIHGIQSLRNELREELHDVIDLVETDFLAERRRIKTLETQRKYRKKIASKRKHKLKSRHKNTYDVLVSALTALVLPLTVVGGLMGMNITVPKVGFWALIGGTVGVSVAFFILLYIMFRIRKPTAAELSRIDAQLRINELDPSMDELTLLNMELPERYSHAPSVAVHADARLTNASKKKPRQSRSRKRSGWIRRSGVRQQDDDDVLLVHADVAGQWNGSAMQWNPNEKKFQLVEEGPDSGLTRSSSRSLSSSGTQ